MQRNYMQRNYMQGKVDCVVGLDSRGFLFGSTMALELGVPFVPIRNLVFDVSIFSYFDRFS